MSTDSSVVTQPSAESAPTQVVQHFIGGQSVEATSGRFGTVYHPSSGKAARRVGFASRADVDRAVDAAAAAFPAWAAAPPLRRARILNKFLRIVEENIDALAQAITAEHGKVLSDAKGDIQRGLEVVEFAVGAPQLLKGEVTENVGTRVDSHSLRQPSPNTPGTGGSAFIASM
jgi:malonate-semialdehyde dehydrogenase (acetylating)/methylmalonate-semialdehyde dehydrogenase